MKDALTILVANAAHTATFNTATLNLPDAGEPDFGFKYKLSVYAVSGTTPTLVAGLYVSRDGGTTYLLEATFDNPKSATANTITAPGEYYASLRLPTLDPAASATFPLLLRFQATIAGTTPSFTLEVAQVLGWN
jgi:hypothetical protein